MKERNTRFSKATNKRGPGNETVTERCNRNEGRQLNETPSYVVVEVKGVRRIGCSGGKERVSSCAARKLKGLDDLKGAVVEREGIKLNKLG
jgi:hypothetical protein